MTRNVRTAWLLGSCLALPAASEPVTWMATETVDTGVAELSHVGARALVYVEDAWLVAYVASGEVVVRERDDVAGWGAPQPMTSGAGVVSAPQLAYSGGIVHLVWEDDRNGHPEIYTRRHDGIAWTAEDCLTCDEVRSAAAALAGRDRHETGPNDDAFVVWEEGSIGSTAIRGRLFTGGAWQSDVPISLSPASAGEPAIARRRGSFAFTWTDTRNGELDIYHRHGRTSLSSETNVTAFITGDAIRSSIRCESEMTDYEEPFDVITYRGHIGSFPILSAVVVAYDTLWPIEGIGGGADAVAQTSSFAKPTADFCSFWGGILSRGEWLTATSAGADGARTASVLCFTELPEGVVEASETMTSTGIGALHLGAYEGKPQAKLMALWVEDVGGTATLKARRGSEIGGSASTVVQTSPSLLISPEGTLASSAVVEDTYSGETVSCEACLYFESVAVFDSGETVYCEDPPGPFTWTVRGGGCDPSGRATISSTQDDLGFQWIGVRSPDVDGNCLVDLGDRAYVEAMQGTSDFCADLDGSGLVDATDLAIVDGTLGDACASVGVENTVPGIVRPRLSLAPNPARSTAIIRLTAGGPSSATMTVLDAAGRRVRELAADVSEGQATVPWDLTDGRGVRVGAGTYFVVARVADTTSRARLIVID